MLHADVTAKAMGRSGNVVVEGRPVGTSWQTCHGHTGNGRRYTAACRKFRTRLWQVFATGAIPPIVLGWETPPLLDSLPQGFPGGTTSQRSFFRGKYP